MSWVDISVGSGSGGSGSSNNILSGLVNSLWNSLNNAGSEGIIGASHGKQVVKMSKS